MHSFVWLHSGHSKHWASWHHSCEIYALKEIQAVITPPPFYSLLTFTGQSGLHCGQCLAIGSYTVLSKLFHNSVLQNNIFI